MSGCLLVVEKYRLEQELYTVTFRGEALITQIYDAITDTVVGSNSGTV